MPCRENPPLPPTLLQMSPSAETDRLSAIAAHSLYSAGINTARTEYSGAIFARHFKGARCLELGPAEGIMTSRLAHSFPDLTVVEGAEPFCASLRIRFPRATVVHSLFETFAPSDPFDTIVLGHVLEHVENPVDLLRQAAAWLTPGGVICTAVPNARSIHRQAAVILGILATEHTLNPTDLHHGHRRVYDPESFRAEFLAAGLSIDAFGGYWLKPLSNAQIERDWTPEMNQAFLQLGERYPDIAAEIYVIASRRT
jgi:2-polyprenyl-3-methyl-5-hydroxy-6-metoxy-1,4-benzoquinol methylase